MDGDSRFQHRVLASGLATMKTIWAKRLLGVLGGKGREVGDERLQALGTRWCGDVTMRLPDTARDLWTLMDSNSVVFFCFSHGPCD